MKEKLDTLTVFGRVSRLGHWRDFTRRRPVMANLMQEVDGLADQQNLYRNKSEREREREGKPVAWR